MLPYFDGLKDGGVDEFNNIVELVENPFSLIEGIHTLISNPRQVLSGIADDLVTQIESATCSGKKSYLAGKATAIVGTGCYRYKGSHKSYGSPESLLVPGVWATRISGKIQTIKANITDKVLLVGAHLRHKNSLFWEKRIDEIFSKRIQEREISSEVSDILTDDIVEGIADEVEDEIIDQISTEIRTITNSTFNGFVENGPFIGKVKFKVHEDYLHEIEWYKNPLRYDNFDLKQAIEDRYIQGDLPNNFYSINKALNDNYFLELTNLNEEIIFVLKQNGEIIISPRGKYKIPHPILSNGQDVISAGTIKFYENNKNHNI